MSNWTKFVTEYYKKKVATNPEYKFKDAMKDAAKEYKKGTPAVAKTKKSGKSRKSKKSVKSRKNKKH